MTRAKIFLVSEFGNHSNRLFQHIQFEAYAKFSDALFWNLCAGDLAAVYNGLRHTVAHGVARRLIKGPLSRLVPYFDVRHPEELAACIEGSPLRSVAVGGWNFRATPEMIRPSHEAFAQKFKPRIGTDHGGRLKAEIISRRKIGQRIIGCHVRRGDYITWQGGKYSFSDEEYSSAIGLAALHSGTELGKCCVLVCSNDGTLTPNRENVLLSAQSWFTDHELLGLCDVIVGPPSTFSSWSSFLHQKPLYVLDRPGGNVGLFFAGVNKGNPDHAFNYRDYFVGKLTSNIPPLFSAKHARV